VCLKRLYMALFLVFFSLGSAGILSAETTSEKHEGETRLYIDQS